MRVKLSRTEITDRERAEEILRKEGYSTYLWSDPAGTYYPIHTHADYEVRWVLEGEVVIGVEGNEYLLRPGDRIELEPQTPHWAKTQKGVVYLCGSK